MFVAYLFSVALISAAPESAIEADRAAEGKQITWRMVGPGGGGWIESVAWDPSDRNVLYVGCDVGGFYFSADGGRTYEVRNHGLHDYFVESIAVNPRDSRTILIGTESGIHRTTDRGQTWQWIRTGFPPTQSHGLSAPIGALCFDPIRPNVAYAGLGRPRWQKGPAGAIYRSSDGGRSWQPIAAGQLPAEAIIGGLQVKPDDSRTILAATSEGVFRSDDEGQTWQPSGKGLPHRNARHLAFAQSDPQVVYVCLTTTARDKQLFNGGVYRSPDTGRTWQAANGPGLPNTVGQSSQDPHMTSNIVRLAVDPRNANLLYAADEAWVSAGVYKTIDAGAHWQRVTNNDRTSGNMQYGWIRQWGPSAVCLAISPAEPDRVAFGTSGHVFTTENGGQTWQQRYCRELPDGRIAGTGLEVTCLNAAVFDPVHPQRLYFCYADIGLLISDDLGQTFRHSVQGMKYPNNCFTLVVDPQSPKTIWAATGQWETNLGDICRSDDGGQSWHVVGKPESGLPVGQVQCLLLDRSSPASKRRLLATSKGNGIYESHDGGQSWHPIHSDLPADARKDPRGLVLDPTDPRRIIAVLAGGAANAGLYQTRDGGAHWQRLSQPSYSPDVQCFIADPRRPEVLYMTTRQFYDQASKQYYPGGVLKSADRGQTWQPLLTHRFATSVAVSPTDSQTLYATTSDHPYHDDSVAEGVLKSTDGGRTWRHENTGLSVRNIKSLTISPHDPTSLVIGVQGNSAFIGSEKED